MTPKLEEQLRRYRRDFEAAQAEIRLEDVRTRHVLRPLKPHSQPGWLVAIGVAASTLLIVGGITLGLGLLTGDRDFVDGASPPTVEPTTVPPTTAVVPPTTVTSDSPVMFTAQLFTEEHGLTGPVMEVAVDEDGVVWAVGSALYRLDGGTWALASDTVPVREIEWMVPAPEGGVILGGGPSCAVALFNGEQWASLDVTPMPRCSAQAASDGRAWIFGYDEDQAPTFVEVGASGVVAHPSGPIPPSFPVAELRLTFDVGPDGALWYGTADGAWSHDGNELTFHPLGAPQGCCPPSLAVGRNGDVWVQLGADVFRYSDDVRTRFTPADGVPDFGDTDPATVIPTADGGVWIVNTSSVSRFDGTAWITYSAAEAIEQGLAFGHSGVSVESPDGSTWILSYASGGSWWLARYDDGRWKGGALDTMRWAEPSPGPLQVNRHDVFNRPLVVAPDGSGWIATTRGVARITIVE